ncbi:reverse transcriptase [Plakobranchus ocellatus]|uniref:Reverse transcriptase n=1 Tax=Plakobranchus ocellatus TaxID=259542 RepID=A0AAV3ZMF2_9GAST|nr:reverse transcriptase [Plakobranchus ocellatus]
MLIPKLLWPLLVNEISSSTVKSIKAKINKFKRKLIARIQIALLGVAIYRRKAKLRLPLKSVVKSTSAEKLYCNDNARRFRGPNSEMNSASTKIWLKMKRFRGSYRSKRNIEKRKR